MKRKKLLLLGSEGFLGRSVASLLIRNDYVNLICHSRKVFSLEGIERLARYLDELKPDIIINCAAFVDFSIEADLGKFYSINALVPSIIANYIKNCDGFYIHASTVNVYGSKAENISTKSEISLDTPYAHSKYLGDLMVQASKAKSCILRFAGIWGNHGPEHLGINRVIRAAQGGKSPKIYEGSHGDILRNYIHVNCAANVISHCMENKLEGIFLTASPNSTPIKKMMQLIANKFQLDEPQIIKMETQTYNQIVEASHEIKSLTLDFEDALKKYE